MSHLKENFKLSAANKTTQMVQQSVTHEMLAPISSIIQAVKALKKRYRVCRNDKDTQLALNSATLLQHKVVRNLDRIMLDQNKFRPQI